MTLDILKNIKLKKPNEQREQPPFTHMNPFVNPNALQEMKQRILRD